MHIESVAAFPMSYEFPRGKTVPMGIGNAQKRDVIVVRVRTDDGLVGYGEAHPGRSPGAVATHINNTLGPLVRGMDPCDVVGVWSRVHRMQLASHGLGAASAIALSGIDLALWDIRGKAANMPLYRLLGGTRRRVRAYAGGVAMGYQPPAALAEEAAGHVARGYKAVKLRVGDSVGRDIERIRAVRQALGDGVEILVDANTAYTLDDVRRVLPALEDLRVSWLEEPFACNDFASYRAAARISQRVPLAAGENHYTRYEFARMLEDRAVQVFQPDLSKTGGVTETLRIAAMASAWRIPVNPHSSAGGINMAATIHLLAAIDNAGYFEGCVSQLNPLRDMFGAPFEIGEDGCVEPIDRPGLGLDIDEKVFEAFPLIDGIGYA